MKTLNFLMLAALAFVLSCCKATQPTGPPSGAAPSLAEVNNLLDTTEKTFIAYAQQTNGNPSQAIMLTTAWLQTQPTVASAGSDDSIIINIMMKSGLEAVFSFQQTDTNAVIFRGAGKKFASEDQTIPEDSKITDEPYADPQTLATNTIANNNVLIFASDTISLPMGPQLNYIAKLIASSGLGLNLTILQNEQCTYQAVSTFGNYGLVIIDGHGHDDGFLVGTPFIVPTLPASEEAMKAIITTQGSTDNYNQLTSGNLELGSSVKGNTSDPQWQKKARPDSTRTQWVTTKYLSTTPNLPNTVLFGNMCHSGNAQTSSHYGTPIRTAFLSKNPISYYCYVVGTNGSYSVGDNFAKQMEDSLLQRLVINQDSTGVANLKSDNMTEFFDPDTKNEDRVILNFRHFGANNYSYQKCGDTLVDVRDGQKYATACIGTQKWMAQNLNYNAPGSYSYDSIPSNGVKYGRLYPWTVAMGGAPATNANPSGVRGICPSGWHVPSYAEWMQMLNVLGGASVAGGALKSIDSSWNQPNISATNSSGFAALPGGAFGWQNLGVPTRAFYGLGNLALFHSASLSPSDTTIALLSVQATVGSVIFPYKVYDSIDPYQPPGNASCRCVKDP
jgi:uncharacterized protein (TIGR02145 family)